MGNGVFIMQKKYKKLNSLISLPTISGELSAEITGNRCIHVRGCRRISLYTPSKISLELTRGFLNICGSGLTCTAYSGRSMGIEGAIKCVFFSDTLSGGCR